jgi:hypothetical protein
MDIIIQQGRSLPSWSLAYSLGGETVGKGRINKQKIIANCDI